MILKYTGYYLGEGLDGDDFLTLGSGLAGLCLSSFVSSFSVLSSSFFVSSFSVSSTIIPTTNIYLKGEFNFFWSVTLRIRNDQSEQVSACILYRYIFCGFCAFAWGFNS